MTIATSTTITFGTDKAENEKLVLSGVAAACKALAKGKSTLKFEEQDILCSVNNVHDTSLKTVGEQVVFILKFESSIGVCTVAVRPSNVVMHPEQADCFWVKGTKPVLEHYTLKGQDHTRIVWKEKNIGVFNAKGVKVAECVPCVHTPSAMPFGVEQALTAEEVLAGMQARLDAMEASAA